MNGLLIYRDSSILCKLCSYIIDRGIYRGKNKNHIEMNIHSYRKYINYLGSFCNYHNILYMYHWLVRNHRRMKGKCLYFMDCNWDSWVNKFRTHRFKVKQNLSCK